jgi:hypothetical protein
MRPVSAASGRAHEPMPRTNVVGTPASSGSGAQQCAQAGEREHRINNTICHQCGKPLPATARRHARFCSPAHRAAYHRSSIAAGMARVRFPVAPTRDKAAPYIAIVPDKRFPGLYRLKRTDGSFSDMVNLTRARDALTEVRGGP